MLTKITMDGTDKFGRFSIHHGMCFNCMMDDQLVIDYRKDEFELSERIELDSTIAGNGTGRPIPLGIQCGCYGKFHRQIAHIEDWYDHNLG